MVTARLLEQVCNGKSTKWFSGENIEESLATNFNR
jgi:hypothetical protein